MSGSKNGLRESFAVYADKRIVWIFINGIASGFPWVVIGSAMTLWLKDEGLTRTTIGFFGSIFAAYTLNFLWAPLVDSFKLPVLRNLGQRRSWMLLSQTLICISIVGLAFTDPGSSLQWTSLLALSVAVGGATQDIAIDAYRIDVIGKDVPRVQAAGAAAATAGWWTGYGLIGAVALFIADVDGISWSTTFLVLATFVLLLMLFTLLIKEPQIDREAGWKEIEFKYINKGVPVFMARISATVIEPFRDFFARFGMVALAILLFIMFFKIGESFLGRMSILFYSELGFSKTDIGTYSKLVNWWVTIVFSFISGGFVVRFGLVKGLIVSGLAMACTNLLFALMAVVGPEPWAFVFTVVLDGFTSSFSTVAFVAFISYLTSSTFSATQYALMASLGNLGRTLFSSASGSLVDNLDGNWVVFFLITTLMVIPSIGLLLYIAKRLSLWKVKGDG